MINVEICDAEEAWPYLIKQNVSCRSKQLGDFRKVSSVMDQLIGHDLVQVVLETVSNVEG